MATSVRSDISTILAALVARIVAQSVTTADHCYLVDHDDPDLTQGELLVLFWPRDERPVKTIREAEGRLDRRVRRRLSVLVYTNVNLDEAGRAVAWLTDAAQGHLIAQDAVIDALDTFQPTDAGHNVLTYEPVEWLGLTASQKLANGWGKSILDFDVPYIRNLDQTLQ